MVKIGQNSNPLRPIINRMLRISLCWIVISIMYNTSLAFADSNSGEDRVYTFGVVPQFEQRKIFRIWIPILQALEADTGIRFELVGSNQIPAFETKFLAGEFDFAYMNPYHIVQANDTQGYQPLVNDGSRSLRGIIVVKKSSPIKTIQDLKGQLLAFPSANALGASLIPRAELSRKHGIELKTKYVKTHTSVYLHVVKGLTIAGGGVASTLMRQKPAIRDSLRILYQTEKVNPHPIVAHPRVPKEHVEKIKQALLNMGLREDGSALLSKIPMRSVKEATLNDFVDLKKLKLEEFSNR